MEPEIGVVFNKPNDRLWLLRLREWMTISGPAFDKRGTKARVKPVGSVDQALCWKAELPDERLVLTIGFPREEIEANQRFAVSSGEPIIVGDPDATNINSLASASFLNKEKIVTCSDIIPQLRKSLIRAALRKQVQIRSPSSDEELAGYFLLRYRVWESNGFLRDENKAARINWEIDFWDRTAIPLCAITPDGKVVGCARLLKSQGQEEQPYVFTIGNLLNTISDPVLQDLFRFPHSAQHPFDLLMEFTGFRSHFRALLRARKQPAEIGRVAVDPGYRGQSLSEALVDTAVSFAEARHDSLIFLACRDELVALYAKCGFKPVEGLRSAKFLNIQLPSVVMERKILSFDAKCNTPTDLVSAA